MLKLMGKRNIKKIPALIMVAVFVLSVFLNKSEVSALQISGSVAKDTESANKTVTVAYFESENFQSGSDDQMIKKGYSYEYLQKVSDYTGWKYEYVYGSFGELYSMFLKGEIDLFPGLVRTSERMGRMCFPNYPMDNITSYIYALKKRNSFDSKDIHSFDGAKIGCVKYSSMQGTLNKWIETNEVDVTTVLFDSFDEMEHALAFGEVSAFISGENYSASKSNLVPVYSFKPAESFLTVAFESAELLSTLNEALMQLQEDNPNYLKHLKEKYYTNTVVNSNLSTDEANWVKKHKILKIGYIDDYMPFCGTQNSVTTGVLTEIMSSWIDKLNLQQSLELDYTAYVDFDAMISALNRGDIDVTFPIIDSVWHAEQNNMMFTNTVINAPVSIVYKGRFNENKTDVVAVSSHSAMQKVYKDIFYNDKSTLLTTGPEECLEAVQQDRATCTFYSSFRADYFLRNSSYEGLNSMQMSDSINYCLGVKKGEVDLMSLLNRGISQLNTDNLNTLMYSYNEMRYMYSVREFIRDHYFLFFVGSVSIILILLFIFLTFAITSHRHYVTEAAIRKDLEESRQKAEAASISKSTFLFNMSHDIRTPMNAIIGYTDLLEKAKDDPEKRKKYCKNIKTSGEYLLGIIDNTLEMARIENGRIYLKEEVISSQEMADSCKTIMMKAYGKKKLRIERKVDFQHEYLICDKGKVQEIFLNIIGNAVKYTPEGGSVFIGIREYPSDKEGYVNIEFKVKDTGVGISKEFLPHIFDSFEREKSTTESGVTGTGLGMGIVKHYLDMMDGTINIESELGVGTTVTIVIPHRIVENPVEAVKEEEQQDLEKLRGRRVLLAEDNEINREIFIAILEDKGISVEWSEDGQQCIDKLLSQPAGYFDIILMDIQMPRMNGLTATEKIRSLSDKGYSKIPIVAATANAFEEDRERAIQAGMNDFVGKPIKASVLIETIYRMIIK